MACIDTSRHCSQDTVPSSKIDECVIYSKMHSEKTTAQKTCQKKTMHPNAKWMTTSLQHIF